MSNTNDKWTNKNLKVGDRVMIDWDVCMWLSCLNNPDDVKGLVTEVSEERVYVCWDNGGSASYYIEDSDLVLVTSENKSNNKDSWFEKGEFPPAGTTCEVNHRGEWIDVYIVGIDSEGYCVYENSDKLTANYDGQRFPTMFRPIKELTKEDLEIAELKKSFPELSEETLKSVHSCCMSVLKEQEW